MPPISQRESITLDISELLLYRFGVLNIGVRGEVGTHRGGTTWCDAGELRPGLEWCDAMVCVVYATSYSFILFVVTAAMQVELSSG